ncbi:MAG: aliphatic sulfonate ABC transporter substrate-binding protein [Gallionella sp.]|nr:aliphatic sulfonate ABC transporter substrate-binding protein [Gallionella sp.]
MKHLNLLKSHWILWLVAIWIAAPALAEEPREIRLDYAYYSPSSLVLKHFGWLEEEFKSSGIRVAWMFSAGSNRALDYLSSGSANFGSAAGLSALVSRSEGHAIKAIYVFSRPEWVALVVSKNSTIQRVQDLRGKKIAVTKGTDAYFFLLQSLRQFGVKRTEVEIVNIPHAEGRIAMEQGRVDAWVGLDPHMADSQLQMGSKLLYRNINFISTGFLCVNEQFAKQYPQHVRSVIKAYEKARKWIIAHPAEAAKLQSEESNVPLNSAQLQLERTDFSNPRIGKEHQSALRAAAPLLLAEGLVKSGTDLNKVIDDLIDPSLVKAVSK